MMRFAAMLALALLAASCISFGDADKAEEEQQDTSSIGNVLLEVEALQTFRQLNLSREQMAQLRLLAKETAQPPPPRSAESKVSVKLRKTALELREVLAADGKDEQIEALSQRLMELREAEKAEMGDDFEMSEAARDQAPKLLRALAPAQVAAFIGAIAVDLPDPVDAIVEALDEVRGLKDEEWKSFREALAEEVGRLIAGLDSEKSSECGDKVVQLLIGVRSLSDDEFKMRRPDLVKKAQAIVGNVGPLDVIRNEVEFRLAEMLSNPRLDAALAARLKSEEVTKKEPGR